MARLIILMTAVLMVGCATTPEPAEDPEPENTLTTNEAETRQLYDQDSEFCETQPEPFVCMRELGWEL